MGTKTFRWGSHEQRTPFARGAAFLKGPSSTTRLAELLGKRLAHALRLSRSYLNWASASATAGGRRGGGGSGQRALSSRADECENVAVGDLIGAAQRQPKHLSLDFLSQQLRIELRLRVGRVGGAGSGLGFRSSPLGSNVDSFHGCRLASGGGPCGFLRGCESCNACYSRCGAKQVALWVGALLVAQVPVVEHVALGHGHRRRGAMVSGRAR
eukprot:scaffold65096_cov63-Phaeocystis_antarctica.AAC.3